MIYIIIGIVFVLGNLLAIALCKAAGDADEKMGYK